MADIFISYAREDRPKAQSLAEIFEARGLSVWWDARIEAGEVWDEVIERELAAAHCIVVLWSKTSVQKRWVRVEANEGLERNILVPVCIDRVNPPIGFRLVQWQDMTSWSGERSHPNLISLVSAAERKARHRVKGHGQWEARPRTLHKAEERARRAKERARQEQEERARRETEERARQEAEASNTMRKKALVQQAETLAGSSDWQQANEALDGLIDQWKEIGSAGREADERLWKQLQTAHQKFLNRYNEHEEAVKRTAEERAPQEQEERAKRAVEEQARQSANVQAMRAKVIVIIPFSVIIIMVVILVIMANTAPSTEQSMWNEAARIIMANTAPSTEQSKWNEAVRIGTADAYRSYLQAYLQGAHAAEAQKNLGWMYQIGRGVAQDYTQAVQWYRKAAEQGNADAQNNLKAMCRRGARQACS